MQKYNGRYILAHVRHSQIAIYLANHKTETPDQPVWRPNKGKNRKQRNTPDLYATLKEHTLQK